MVLSVIITEKVEVVVETETEEGLLLVVAEVEVVLLTELEEVVQEE